MNRRERFSRGKGAWASLGAVWMTIFAAFAWAALGGLIFPGAASASERRVLGVRHFSTTGYARIVLILNRESFDFNVVRLSRPPRVFIDVPKTRLDRKLRVPSLSPRDSMIRKIRFGRHGPDTTRLVVDLTSRAIRHRVFTLPEPDRIVIDLRRSEVPKLDSASPSPSARSGAGAGPAGGERKARTGARAPPSPRSAGEKKREMELSARFRSGLGRIVLDPGHGGRDPGAVGLRGLVEKEFVLDLARRAADRLRELLPGNRVFLTRRGDQYLSLEKRTAIANDFDADVFISIHANSSPLRRTSGIETYLLSEASSPRVLEIAARESETTVSRMSDLDKILTDLMLRSKVNESQILANKVQRAMISRLRRGYRSVKDLGVKRGPFYVLLGAQMPSVLIEAGFITNSSEARRSRSPRYRRFLADGIAEGIVNFVQSPIQRTGAERRRYADTAPGRGPRP